jgi:hypothetical protein
LLHKGCAGKRAKKFTFGTYVNTKLSRICNKLNLLLFPPSFLKRDSFFNKQIQLLHTEPGYLSGIALGYGLDDRGFESQ